MAKPTKPIEQLISEQNWNDSSLLALAQNFISRDKRRQARFVKYLNEHAEAENRAIEIANADHEDLRRHDALGLNDG